MRKRIFRLVLAVLLALSCSGCGGQRRQAVSIPDDPYRNVYEIFVASYYDSDGDGMGDLNGIAEKLDYLADMGYTAVWLMPIHPSPSYHKYDVTDYTAIDPDYGTLEDFDRLLDEAHQRNIRVYLDLVVNHTSDEHPWFTQAKAALLSGQSSPYIDYYHFRSTAQSGYTRINDELYYEARFSPDMPDLNLDSPQVREAIRQIMAFWLDRGVDGFRLDATTSYYTDSAAANTEFLSWLSQQARQIKPDCYLVGEAWAGDNVIRQYYQSGVDSFFHFSFSQADGVIARSLTVSAPAPYYARALQQALDITHGHIPAIFLDNHDTNRIANGVGKSQREKLKFVYGLAALFNGCVYTYYGTEIGMVGTGKDENKRIAMLWDSDDPSGRCADPAGATAAEYVYPGVKQQQKDPQSLLNYHRQMNYLRNRYPAIARGQLSFPEGVSTDTLLVVEKEYEGQKIAIVINFDPNASATVDLGALGYSQMEYAAVGTDRPAFRKGVLTLPGYGIAVLSGRPADS